MKKTFTKKRSAFSLIELSIVLIIIGLLIAGVTGGASLIKSSELRSAMGEARGYSVAVNAFYTQFNELPGDFDTGVIAVPNVTTPTNTLAFGNGNGQIEFCGTGCVTGVGDSTGSEGSIAWHHLAAIGAIETAPDFVGGGTAVQTVGTNYPASKIKSAGWGFDYNSDADIQQNVVVLTRSTTVVGTPGANSLVNGTPMSVGALNPTDALSIDSKIDDGAPTTGRVRGILVACISETDYNVASGATECALSFQVDVNS
jgi:prepilin-type N-terminal cleavage/methylation domain-containing protein